MEVLPQKNNLDSVFSNTPYYIDFYQREYKWTREQVITLLDDIFHKFNLEYTPSLDPNADNISKYSWYYLNTYITNNSNGKTYLVDGQQRLTTMTLILVELYRLAKKYEVPNLEKWIESKIRGFTSQGDVYWMGQEKREPVMKKLTSIEVIEKKTYESEEDVTVYNMYRNYTIICDYFAEQLVDSHKFQTFVFFFLQRLVLVNLEVQQTDVPMVFEVINDRGVRLKPYEILKGKLLGQIEKEEVNRYHDIWEESFGDIENDDKDLVDDLLRTYLKARYTSTKAEGKKFDGNYQRAIFEPEFDQLLKLKNNPVQVKSFLSNDIRYYSRLYKKIKIFSETYHSEYRHIFFNTLTEMNTQYHLIIAGCSIDDPLEDEKIKIVSRNVDRMFVLLQLNKSYDSNRFTDMVYQIADELRNAQLEVYNSIFDSYLIAEINEKRNSTITSPFEYKFFKEAGYQDFNKRFLRYFFARVELFLSEGIGNEMKFKLQDLVLSTGSISGFHIEHILSRNNENLGYFDDDDELFERERNRLGALLLLRGKDNQSSSNELYQDKLRTYSSTLLWNESLCEDFYKSKISIRDFINENKLNFKNYDIFDRKALEERSEVLFDIVTNIWGS